MKRYVFFGALILKAQKVDGFWVKKCSGTRNYQPLKRASAVSASVIFLLFFFSNAVPLYDTGRMWAPSALRKGNILRGVPYLLFSWM